MKKITTVLLIALALLGGSLAPPSMAHAGETVDVWWPTDGAKVNGSQPFKSVVYSRDVNAYDMYWQVDNGTLNAMPSNWTDYPHKEAVVDVSGWNWRGNGPYAIRITAKQNGVLIAEKTVNIYIDRPAAPNPTQISEAPRESTNPLAGMKMYVNPKSQAALQMAYWSSKNATYARALSVIAREPQATWLGNWNTDISRDVKSVMANAAASSSVPIFVLYNIPGRDCGQYSAGGAVGTEAYKSWVGKIASAIGDRKAVVVVEPDAILLTDCLSSGDREARFTSITDAVAQLKAKQNIKVYIDAGHSGWKDASEVAGLLKKVGVSYADGFSLNVSNFKSTSSTVQYGSEISRETGGKHFVVDTSRNGAESEASGWCNPPGRALGSKPTTSAGNDIVDAFLWVKAPGESDGSCNGGPSAGVWWNDYALGLIERSGY